MAPYSLSFEKPFRYDGIGFTLFNENETAPIELTTAPAMSTRPATISCNRLPLLLLLLVTLFGVTACNQVDSGKDALIGQEVHEIPETKAEEDSRIKRGFHWLLSTLQGNDESIAEITGKEADVDTTLLHLQENTVAVQVVPLYITQTQEAEEKIAFGPRVTAVSVGMIGTAVRDISNGFDKLSDSRLKDKIKRCGLGGERGIRNSIEANQFYLRKVPIIIRDMGEPSIWDFFGCQGGKDCQIRGKHCSHIVSNQNDKGKVKDPKNVVMESKTKNQNRGEKNMTRKDVFQAEWGNTKDVSRIIKKRPLSIPWVRYAKWGGGFGMAAEAPIAGLENFYHWQHGQKSLGQAIEDTAINIAIGTGMGIVTHLGFVVLSSAIGSSVMVPLAIVGGVVYIGTTVYRIVDAANLDLNWGASMSRLYNTTLQKLPLLPRKHNVSTP